MKKLTATLLALFCVFTMVYAVGCNGNTKYSYWQINKLVSSNDPDDVMTQFVEVSLKDNDIKEFWINISAMSVSETTLGFVFGSSTSLNKVTISRNFILTSDGWYQVKASGSSKTFKITFTDEMRVNEIVFVNEKDEVMEFEFTKYVIRPSFTSDQNQTFTKEDLEELGEKNSALCAFDEQDKFDLAKATEAFKKAEEANKQTESTDTESSSK